MDDRIGPDGTDRLDQGEDKEAVAEASHADEEKTALYASVLWRIDEALFDEARLEKLHCFFQLGE